MLVRKKEVKAERKEGMKIEVERKGRRGAIKVGCKLLLNFTFFREDLS